MLVDADKVKEVRREGEDLVLVVSPDGILVGGGMRPVVEKLYSAGWRPKPEDLPELLTILPEVALLEDEQRVEEAALMKPGIIPKLVPYLSKEARERILEMADLDLETIEALLSLPEFRVSEKVAGVLLSHLKWAERWKRSPRSDEGWKFSRALRLAARLKREGKLPPEVDRAYQWMLADFKLENLRRRAKSKEGLEEMLALLPFLPPEKRAKAVAILLLGEHESESGKGEVQPLREATLARDLRLPGKGRRPLVLPGGGHPPTNKSRRAQADPRRVEFLLQQGRVPVRLPWRGERGDGSAPGSGDGRGGEGLTQEDPRLPCEGAQKQKDKREAPQRAGSDARGQREDHRQGPFGGA